MPAFRNGYADGDRARATIVEKLGKKIVHATAVAGRAETPLIFIEAVNCHGDPDRPARRRADESDHGFTTNRNALTAGRPLQHADSASGGFRQQAHPTNNNTR
jgi:hypothetical protein